MDHDGDDGLEHSDSDVEEPSAQPSSFRSSFDAYFTHASTSARTSSNVFSALVAPLSNEEYAALSIPTKNADEIARLERVHAAAFPHHLLELAQGFNLLFYGLGSKRVLLNRFAAACAPRGHVVVASAFLPAFALAHLLTSIERIPGLTELPLAGAGPEARARRIARFFAAPFSAHNTAARPLFLIVHALDAPPLRTARARTCLALLTSAPRIHVAASTDHIRAPLLWRTAALSTRKRPGARGGGAWLWHDTTTLRPYDAELAFADRASFAGASAQHAPRTHAGSAAPVGALVSESAARHVLASVTQKARKLLALLAARQLAALAADTDAGAGVAPLQQHATSYELLFAAARDDFIATSDTALRALLGEFRDHGLVAFTTAAGPEGGEALWIPLAKDVLSRILKELTES